MLKISSLFALAVCAAAQTTPHFYSARPAYQSFTTTAVGVADFNGDGKPDIAAAVPFGIAVQLGDGTDTLGFPVKTPIDTSCAFILLIADFNGDGRPDIMCSLANSTNFQILLGNGDGTFGGATTVNFGNYDAIAVGDLNHDGKADVVVGYGSDLDVYLGNGNGTFQPPIVNDYRKSIITYVIIADVNGDGIPDVVSVKGTAILVSLGVGNGKLHKPIEFVTSAQSIESIVAADLTGNGKLDIMAAINSGDPTAVSHLGIFIQQSDGTLTQTLYPTDDPISEIQSADLNGDGIPDIAARSNDGTALEFLFNLGGGIFGPASQIAVPQISFQLADLRGGGLTDVVLTDGNTLQVLVNPGNGAFTAGVQETGGAPGTPCITGDFNGDGIVDLACLNQFQIFLFLGTNDPTEPFTPPLSIELIGTATAIAAADFDGNGTLDLAAALTDSTILFLSNSGAGTFVQEPKRSDAGPPLTAMISGDFTGDGHADLFTSAGVLLPSLGNGQFSAPITVVPSPALPYLATADLNGDGTPDIVAVAGGNNPPLILFSKSGGGFKGMTLSGVEAQYLPVIADVNGDGNLDLVFPAGNFGVSVALGDGHGKFTVHAPFAPAFWPPIISAAVADFNGDGKADLAYGIPGYSVWVATGKGNGSFNTPAAGFGVADATSLTATDVGNFGPIKRPDLIAGSGPATVLIGVKP